jgi:hypothetical protein
MTNPGLQALALKALAGGRDFAAHRARALVGVVIVKVRVETLEARADIAARPRVRSCNKSPMPITLAELLPLNLGKRTTLLGRHENAPLLSVQTRGRVPRSHK